MDMPHMADPLFHIQNKFPKNNRDGILREATRRSGGGGVRVDLAGMLRANVGRYLDKEWDWHAFPANEGYPELERAQMRYIGSGGSPKDDATALPAGAFSCSLIFQEPGRKASVHHHKIEELFFVHAGRLTMTWQFGDETIDFVCGPGDAVLNPPSRPHGFRNDGPEDCLLQIMVATAGPMLPTYTDHPADHPINPLHPAPPSKHAVYLAEIERYVARPALRGGSEIRRPRRADALLLHRQCADARGADARLRPCDRRGVHGPRRRPRRRTARRLGVRDPAPWTARSRPRPGRRPPAATEPRCREHPLRNDGRRSGGRADGMAVAVGRDPRLRCSSRRSRLGSPVWAPSVRRSHGGSCKESPGCACERSSSATPRGWLRSSRESRLRRRTSKGWHATARSSSRRFRGRCFVRSPSRRSSTAASSCRSPWARSSMRTIWSSAPGVPARASSSPPERCWGSTRFVPRPKGRSPRP